MRKLLLILFLLSLATLTSCDSYRTFITYFNTYYNADRLMWEAENEFEFQDDKKRIYPRVFVPESELHSPAPHSSGPPPFLEETIVNKKKRQPVEVKLDSIIIKGSKILAKSSKTKYVEGTLFLMAKSYFYKEEWLPAQLKCTELIDFYPTGKYSPDAHLLLSKTLLIQRKLEAGETMLSRTVDISWQLERYDILSEAFRLEAELALYQNDIEKALRPYRQAIAQTDKSTLKAKWQVEIGSILYRRGEFERARNEFAKARKYRTDYMGEYESYLYEAASLNRLGQYEEAEKILNGLMKEKKYKEWRGYASGEILQAMRLKYNDNLESETFEVTLKDLQNAETDADSSYANNPYVITYYFDRGLDEYYKNDYIKARNYFSKARVVKTPVSETSKNLYELTNLWDVKQREIALNLNNFREGNPMTDSTKLSLAKSIFELGRVHEQLSNQDSAQYYYQISAEVSPINDQESARYYYAYARTIRESDPYASDSLYQLIVDNYALTEYGQDAMKRMGFTDAFVIDTVRELFESGYRLMTYENYPYSIGQLSRVFNEYPENDYAPRSLYTVGWIYERKNVMQDSALYYYRKLINEYPESEYAKDVRLSVDYLLAVRSGEPIPDSLAERKFIDSRMQREQNARFQDAPVKGADPLDAKNQQFDPKQMLNHPSNMLKDGKEGLKNQFNKLKDFKLPDNPLKLLTPSEADTIKIEGTVPEELPEK